MQVNSGSKVNNDNLQIENVLHRKCPIFIDYFKVSIDDVVNFDTYQKWLANQLGPYGLTISQRKASLPKQYDLAYKITIIENTNIVCGSICYSQRFNRILLTITGNGCSIIEHAEPDFNWFQVMARQPKVFLRRVDLSFDDFLGLYSIEKVDRDYSRGRFNAPTGVRPQKENMGSKSVGRTRYIGGKTAYKRACIYEKGLQQNLQLSQYANWLRFEVRFISNSRDKIPNEIIERRDDYFFSAYPGVVKKIVGTANYLSVAKREAIKYQSGLGRKAGFARYSYGRVVGQLRSQMSDGDVLALLSREGDLKGVTKLPIMQQQDLHSTQDVLESVSRGVLAK